MKSFNKLCTPAKIYFGIAVIATIISLLNGFHMIYAFWKIIFAFIWTFVLGWLCKKGYTSISWFLVLLPYVLILLAMLNIYNSEDPRRLMRAIKLQGAYGQEAFIEGFGFKKRESEELPIGQEEQGIKKIKKLESKPLYIKEETIIEDRPIREDEVVIEQNPILEEDEVVIEENPILEEDEFIIKETPVSETITTDQVVTTNNSPFGPLSYYLGG